MKNEKNIDKLHPWSEFLHARLNAIMWMHNDKKRNDSQIAESLSMDEYQVFLIRTSTDLFKQNK